MTSFAFILGVFPLAIATGAGAEMRQSLGTAVFFGMLGVTDLRPAVHSSLLHLHSQTGNARTGPAPGKHSRRRAWARIMTLELRTIGEMPLKKRTRGSGQGHVYTQRVGVSRWRTKQLPAQ